MPIRRHLARFNRAVANPLIGGIVAATPGFGAVYHRGRRSGSEYRTPVMVFRDGERYVIALLYGTDSDWVRNVLAAGGCDLLTRGRRLPMIRPHVASGSDISAVAYRVLGALGARKFLTLVRDDR